MDPTVSQALKCWCHCKKAGVSSEFGWRKTHAGGGNASSVGSRWSNQFKKIENKFIMILMCLGGDAKTLPAENLLRKAMRLALQATELIQTPGYGNTISRISVEAGSAADRRAAEQSAASGGERACSAKRPVRKIGVRLSVRITE